jgi:hypothetical protein
MKAPFKIGLSDFFLKSLINFAGVFPLSENKTEVFPLSVDFKSPNSFPLSSIAFLSKVFLTTEIRIFDLKHALLSSRVDLESNPAMSAKYKLGASATSLVRAFISLYIGDDKIDILADLKSKDELIGEIITLLMSPINNVLSSLKSGSIKISGIIKKLSDK